MKRVLSREWTTDRTWILPSGLARAAEPPAMALPTPESVDDTDRAKATESARPARLTPQHIAVIDRPARERRDVDSLNHALRYAFGMTPELRGGSRSFPAMAPWRLRMRDARRRRAFPTQ